MSDALRGDSRSCKARSPLRSSLAVVQVMFSVVLQVGAGLLLRSMQRVNATDFGMDAEKVLIVEVRYLSAAAMPVSRSRRGRHDCARSMNRDAAYWPTPHGAYQASQMLCSRSAYHSSIVTR